MPRGAGPFRRARPFVNDWERRGFVARVRRWSGPGVCSASPCGACSPSVAAWVWARRSAVRPRRHRRVHHRYRRSSPSGLKAPRRHLDISPSSRGRSVSAVAHSRCRCPRPAGFPCCNRAASSEDAKGRLRPPTPDPRDHPGPPDRSPLHFDGDLRRTSSARQSMRRCRTFGHRPDYHEAPRPSLIGAAPRIAQKAANGFPFPKAS